MYDVLIRGGRVVDGTGAPEFVGDVAVTDGHIVRVGDVTGTAHRVIDAEGMLVTPGWVDLHTHYDGQVMWDPILSPSGWHGVTTVVVGNCGVGFAPCRPTDRELLLDLMEGIEDIPGADIAAGMPWLWETFPQYLDAVERVPHVMDVAALLPHNVLRVHVMGAERGNAEASAEELATMVALAREAIEAGAVGISTSRSLGHFDKHGNIAPGTWASSKEMLALGSAMEGVGRRLFSVVSQDLVTPPLGPTGFDWYGKEFRNEGFEGPEHELAWMAELSSRYHQPVTFMLVDRPLRAPGGWRGVLERALAHNRDGAWLVPQVQGKATAIMIGWGSPEHLFSHHRAYEAIADLPLAERIGRLRDPEVRRAILDEPLPDDPDSRLRIAWHRMIDNGQVFGAGNPPNFEPGMDRSVKAIAQQKHKSVLEVVYDLMMEDDGGGLLFAPPASDTIASMNDMREMLVHPSAVIGLADGGAHAAVTCDASVPTFMLTHWALGRTTGERIPLEHVVHLQTQRTASLVGFRDRGRLAPGYLADINVIDVENLRLLPTRVEDDLPAGGRRLLQGASGYRATLKSGVVVREFDESTGEMPGALLRGEQPSPIVR